MWVGFSRYCCEKPDECNIKLTGLLFAVALGHFGNEAGV